ncbi:hypothetical protein M3J09_004928 [Ascochyta lentis]
MRTNCNGIRTAQPRSRRSLLALRK